MLLLDEAQCEDDPVTSRLPRGDDLESPETEALRIVFVDLVSEKSESNTESTEECGAHSKISMTQLGSCTGDFRGAQSLSGVREQSAHEESANISSMAFDDATEKPSALDTRSHPLRGTCMKTLDFDTLQQLAARDSTQVYVFAKQGKSRHTRLWSLDDLISSCENLREVGEKIQSHVDDYVIPAALQEGLAGQVVVLRNISKY